MHNRTLSFLGQPVRSLSLEITNRCYLGCSECMRNLRPDLVKEPVDISLDDLKFFLPLKLKSVLSPIKMNLCGSLGDAIYHPQILDIVSYLRELDCPIYLETNGSFKDVSFWRELSSLLGKNNWLNFSVDGLADTNHLYRERSRWGDVDSAMKTCVNFTNVRWKWIVFKTNEHQISAAKKYAQLIGVKHFMLQKSDRFKVEADKLTPDQEQWKSFVLKNKQLIKQLLTDGNEKLEEIDIRPRCLVGKGLSIGSNGLFHPCQGSYSSSLWGDDKRTIEGLPITQMNLEDALAHSCWDALKQSWQSAFSAPEACIRKCGVHTKYKQFYDDFKSKKDLNGSKPFVDEIYELNPSTATSRRLK